MLPRVLPAVIWISSFVEPAIGVYGNMRNMAAQLTQVVSDVRAGASNVASGSTELSASAEGLSQGATEQAASIEEVSASIEEMASNIKQNTLNARQPKKSRSSLLRMLRKVAVPFPRLFQQ